MSYRGFKSTLTYVCLVFILTMTLSCGSSKDPKLTFKDKIGVINITGVIWDSFEINEDIKDFRGRSDIKALVIRIDSPGGAVAPSQEIYSEVMKTRKVKPVYVSMGNMAASGGYYIAAGADKIYANPGTITGSIGVIMEFLNVEALYEKLGLKGQVIKSGKFKDIGSGLRDMTDDEKEILQALIDDVYGQFVDAISVGRNIKRENIIAYADGRVFSGSKAKEIGFVDELGTLEDTIEAISLEVGIKDEPLVVYPKEDNPGIWRFIFGDTMEETLNLKDKIRGAFSGYNIMYLLTAPKI